jgi:hypothetical protein
MIGLKPSLMLDKRAETVIQTAQAAPNPRANKRIALITRSPAVFVVVIGMFFLSWVPSTLADMLRG